MFNCVLCRSVLEIFDSYKQLNNVTSDSKPIKTISNLAICTSCGHIQKCVTPDFTMAVSKIYKEYEIFALSKGIEQIIFSDLGDLSRSELIALWLQKKLVSDGKIISKILDYGCGDCSALLSLSALFGNADVYGYEIEDLHRPKTKLIKNFKGMFIGPEFIPEIKFDLITMIHCLEHISNPVNVLKNIRNNINENKYLFIQVPDMVVSKYDLLVADHVSHFTEEILCELLNFCGFEIVASTSNYLKKEITLLAKKSNSKRMALNKNVDRFIRHKKHVNAQISSHIRTVKRSQEIFSKNEKLAIFGSSISAMWLYGELNKAIRIFVDEDSNKWGKHDHYEIINPQQVPEDYKVIVPLIDEIAERVSKNYTTQSIEYIVV